MIRRGLVEVWLLAHAFLMKPHFLKIVRFPLDFGTRPSLTSLADPSSACKMKLAIVVTASALVAVAAMIRLWCLASTVWAVFIVPLFASRFLCRRAWPGLAGLGRGSVPWWNVPW